MVCATVIEQGYLPPAEFLSIRDHGRAVLTIGRVQYIPAAWLFYKWRRSSNKVAPWYLRSRLGMSVSSHIPDSGAPPLVMRSIATDVLAFLPRAPQLSGYTVPRIRAIAK